MVISKRLRGRQSPAKRLEQYPPFRRMGVRVVDLAEDWRQVVLCLPLAGNSNPGGGMFGGAMACLADPIAALACNRVFPGHQVWTRDLHLDFHRESRSDMLLKFALRTDHEREIASELANKGRATPSFDYAFFDERERACVGVQCRVAIRPADYRPRAD